MLCKIRDTPMLATGGVDYDAIHPDRELAREIVVETLMSQISEAHAGLLRALDFRTGSPDGVRIKDDVRDCLRRSGYVGDFGYRTTAP